MKWHKIWHAHALHSPASAEHEKRPLSTTDSLVFRTNGHFSLSGALCQPHEKSMNSSEQKILCLHCIGTFAHTEPKLSPGRCHERRACRPHSDSRVWAWAVSRYRLALYSIEVTEFLQSDRFSTSSENQSLSPRRAIVSTNHTFHSMLHPKSSSTSKITN